MVRRRGSAGVERLFDRLGGDPLQLHGLDPVAVEHGFRAVPP
jgi:hypothetical protein